MTKKFFTKVSPKAAGGIRRVYERKGYEVRAKLQSDGSITVVAVKGNEPEHKRGKLFGNWTKRNRRAHGAAA